MHKLLVAALIALASVIDAQAALRYTAASRAPSPPRIHSVSSASGAIPRRIMQGDTVQLSVQASDPQGMPLQYRLLVNGRQALPFGRANVLRWSPHSAHAGRMPLILEVKNAADAVTSQTVEIVVLRKPKTQPAIPGGGL